MVGRWSWNFLVVRLMYSVFSATYRFVLSNLGKGAVSLWENVGEELSAAVALGPIISVDMTAVLSERVYQTDADAMRPSRASEWSRAASRRRKCGTSCVPTPKERYYDYDK